MKDITKRTNKLKKNIGTKLFNKLSYEDKLLMLNTAGVIEFGYPIDLKKLAKKIKN